jgi:DnaJ like chaperone protein
VGILNWLGLRSDDSFPNVESLTRELRRAMPDSESCVLRYIAIVVVLLGRVAWADGGFSEPEEARLRELLKHIDGLAPSGVDAVCKAVRGRMSDITEDELDVCYRELKALCDGNQRVEVLRLLRDLAAVDGRPSAPERAAIADIAVHLGVSEATLKQDVGIRDDVTLT